MGDKDGGPAFPRIERSSPDSLPVRGALIDYVHRSVGGMSLRDYFAGQALAGMSGSPEMAVAIHRKMDDPWIYTAGFCYRVADAMLKERDK